MRITKVEPTQHDQQRVSIFIDERFALACSIDVWASVGLITGDEITPDAVEALGAQEKYYMLKERALRLLASRPYGRVELQRRLAQGTSKHPAPPAAQIAQVVAELADEGILDDQAFATFWVEQRDRFRPKGSLALRAELRGKGLARADVEEAVDTAQDEDRALNAGRRRAQQLAGRPGMNVRLFRDALGPFLMRRGFPLGIARAAIATLWRETCMESEGEEIDEVLLQDD